MACCRASSCPPSGADHTARGHRRRKAQSSPRTEPAARFQIRARTRISSLHQLSTHTGAVWQAPCPSLWPWAGTRHALHPQHTQGAQEWGALTPSYSWMPERIDSRSLTDTRWMAAVGHISPIVAPHCGCSTCWSMRVCTLVDRLPQVGSAIRKAETMMACFASIDQAMAVLLSYYSIHES